MSLHFTHKILQNFLSIRSNLTNDAPTSKVSSVLMEFACVKFRTRVIISENYASAVVVVPHSTPVDILVTKENGLSHVQTRVVIKVKCPSAIIRGIIPYKCTTNKCTSSVVVQKNNASTSRSIVDKSTTQTSNEPFIFQTKKICFW